MGHHRSRVNDSKLRFGGAPSNKSVNPMECKGSFHFPSMDFAFAFIAFISFNSFYFSFQQFHFQVSLEICQGDPVSASMVKASVFMNSAPSSHRSPGVATARQALQPNSFCADGPNSQLCLTYSHICWISTSSLSLDRVFFFTGALHNWFPKPTPKNDSFWDAN